MRGRGLRLGTGLGLGLGLPIPNLTLTLTRYEGGSIGNRERRLSWPTPALPVTPEGAVDEAGQGMPYYLFHYTYGIEYSKEGLPVELQVRGLPGYHPIGGAPRIAAGWS